LRRPPRSSGSATGATGGGATGVSGATASTGGGGGGTAEPSTVVAQNISFDTSTISLPASGATLTFDNQDAGVPHNISIYTDETLGENLFSGELITGPDTVDYSIPAIDPGEYYFLCDVHPNMNGTVTVA